MSRDKQTEIANDLNMHCVSLSEQFCGEMSCNACISNWLYNAGYRKASDVAELEKKIEDLKVLLEMCQKSEEGMRELYNTDINALLEAKRKGEIAIAEEIFAEIENLTRRYHYEWYLVAHMEYDIAELKKKYIGKDTNVTTNIEN